MAKVHVTIQVILWLLSTSYLAAFLSLFFQVPGLYGPRGITPIHSSLPLNSHSILSNWLSSPTLLWLSNTVGIDPSTGLLIICLLGSLLSFCTMIYPLCRSPLYYFILYLLYLSAYQVGGVFLWFQWDALLLEFGALAVFLAPIEPLFFISSCPRPWDTLKLWIIRWLAFRLMFSSGVVKLSAGCPTWWGLSALQVHFESQCIPTQLSWYLHHMPVWTLRLSVVITFFSEIAAPLLFLLPSRTLRLIAFFSQVHLLVGINTAGNYNFFGILSLAAAIAVLDDDWLSSKKKCLSRFLNRLDLWLVTPLVLAVYIYYTVSLFNLQIITDPIEISSSINFSQKEWDVFVAWIVPWTVWLGVAWLLYEILSALVNSLIQPRSLVGKLISVLATCIYSVLALLLFLYSLPSYTHIAPSYRSSLPPALFRWESTLSSYNLASHYGPFRRMTGVGGRPEVIIEWSNQQEDGWQEYNFNYKPGNLSQAPSFIAPHQPRLDWQLWFAALSNYHHTPWIIQLINRLLQNETSVLALLSETPPQPVYVRASHYLYHFKYEGDDWWSRDNLEEYVPALSIDHKTVLDFLKEKGLWSEANLSNTSVDRLVHTLYWTAHKTVSPHVAIWFAFLLAFCVAILNHIIYMYSWNVRTVASCVAISTGLSLFYLIANKNM
ncbi:Lipase maturation factor 2-like isoform X1 [Oopsacas minuta]|uniref:Lipase maturation factor n=1 Tax=Oopsacas minuta TaxID=111878 RepID=A0AAV7JCD8_9METZ|nr:Lipase maturation factor 2-like isoform X1 [Oopsacas minuta]